MLEPIALPQGAIEPPSTRQRFWPVLPQYVDSTMLTAYRSCPRRYYNEFVRGIRPRAKSLDLHAGGVFASTVEFIYRRAHMDLGHDMAVAAGEVFFYKMWGDYEILDPENPKRPDRVWAAIADYFATYGTTTDKIQPYIVDNQPTFEFSFAIPLDGPGFPVHPESGDPFVLVGRADQLGQLDGLPIVKDDKTTKSAGDKWTKQWDMRGQFLGYLWAAQRMGIKANTFCVRGVVIQKTQIKQLEYIRPYSTTLIERWLETTRRDLCRLVSNWNEGAAPTPDLPNSGAGFNYSFGNACHEYGSCMFVESCEAGDPEAWLSQFVEARWNPLHIDPIDPGLVRPAEFVIEPESPVHTTE